MVNTGSEKDSQSALIKQLTASLFGYSRLRSFLQRWMNIYDSECARKYWSRGLQLRSIFALGKWLRIARFPFPYIRFLSLSMYFRPLFRSESSNFSTRVSNLPFQYPVHVSAGLLHNGVELSMQDNPCGLFMFHSLWNDKGMNLPQGWMKISLRC